MKAKVARGSREQLVYNPVKAQAGGKAGQGRTVTGDSRQSG